MLLNFNNSNINRLAQNAEFGIERESLRVTSDGRLAQTEHPFVGDPHIDRDFCENQVEMIGDVFNDPAELNRQLGSMLDEIDGFGVDVDIVMNNAGLQIAYRTDYLAEAGYTVADLTDITWTQFAEIGKQIKEKTGKPVFCTQAGSGDWILIMIQSCGASMFTEDGAVNLKDNAAIKAAITVYADLVKEGVILETNSWDEMIGTLANGSVCGTFNGCWILGSIMATADQSGKWDITNLPSLEGVEGATHYSNNGGSSWAITQGTDVDLAIDFMQLVSIVQPMTATMIARKILFISLYLLFCVTLSDL